MKVYVVKRITNVEGFAKSPKVEVFKRKGDAKAIFTEYVYDIIGSKFDADEFQAFMNNEDFEGVLEGDNGDHCSRIFLELAGEWLVSLETSDQCGEVELDRTEDIILEEVELM